MDGPDKQRKTKSSAGKDPEPQVRSASSGSTATPSTADTTTYHTHVKIFMVSTGDDSGSECELQGWISFPGTGSAVHNFSVDLPVKTSFAQENNGLGRLIAEYSADRAFQPAPFQAFVLEDDTAGSDWILSEVMDWTKPENASKANGQEWTWRWWNTEDNRYQCNLWWQVTPSV